MAFWDEPPFSEFTGFPRGVGSVGNRESHPGHGFDALPVGACAGKGLCRERPLWTFGERCDPVRTSLPWCHGAFVRTFGPGGRSFGPSERSHGALRIVEGLNGLVERRPFPVSRKPNLDIPSSRSCVVSVTFCLHGGNTVACKSSSRLSQARPSRSRSSHKYDTINNIKCSVCVELFECPPAKEDIEQHVQTRSNFDLVQRRSVRPSLSCSTTMSIVCHDDEVPAADTAPKTAPKAA
ncbi:hypothetical protein FB451DRAFT_1367175 [Mycena latifolia]|nr:hypothetical protein FB451DRAFT_1367175 [Mycena latifolia]